MLTAVVDIRDTSVCSELSNNCISHKIKLISCILSPILFLVWNADMNNILITFQYVM